VTVSDSDIYVILYRNTLIHLALLLCMLIVPHKSQWCGAQQSTQLMARIRVRAPGFPSSDIPVFVRL